MSTTATTNEQAAAEGAAPQTDAKKKKTRLARWALPDIDENSALLPSDKWVIDSFKDFAKSSPGFKKTVGRMAGFALGGIAALAAGAVGSLLLFPAAVPLAAVVAVSLAATGIFGKLVHSNVKKFKSEVLPDLRKDIGKKYLELKASELKSAWQKNIDARKKQREAEKAAKAAQEAAQPAVKPEAKAEATEAEVSPQKLTRREARALKKAEEEKRKQALADQPPQKPADIKSIGGTIGGWVLKKAMEKAQKGKGDKEEPHAAKNDPPKPEQPPKP